MAKHSQAETRYREGNPRRSCGLCGHYAIAAVLAALLMCWSGGAFADDLKLPKQFQGIWCSYDNKSEIWHRSKNEDACWNRKGEDLLQVELNWFGFAQAESRCEPKSVRENRGELYVTAECKKMDQPGDWEFAVRWKLLDNGQRLRIIWPKEP
jgi:hypothetical protein